MAPLSAGGAGGAEAGDCALAQQLAAGILSRALAWHGQAGPARPGKLELGWSPVKADTQENALKLEELADGPRPDEVSPAPSLSRPNYTCRYRESHNRTRPAHDQHTQIHKKHTPLYLAYHLKTEPSTKLRVR